MAITSRLTVVLSDHLSMIILIDNDHHKPYNYTMGNKKFSSEKIPCFMAKSTTMPIFKSYVSLPEGHSDVTVVYGLYNMLQL